MRKNMRQMKLVVVNGMEPEDYGKDSYKTYLDMKKAIKNVAALTDAGKVGTYAPLYLKQCAKSFTELAAGINYYRNARTIAYKNTESRLAIHLRDDILGIDMKQVYFKNDKDSRENALKIVRSAIRSKRRARAEVNERTVQYSYQGTYTRMLLVGKVHTECGEFLRMYLKYKNKARADKVLRQKSPKDNASYLGVEIEFFNAKNQDAMVDLILNWKLEDYVQLKGDGSIRPDSGTQGWEIAVLFKEEEREYVMERVCSMLSESGAKVNKSCGLHVHLDARAIKANDLFEHLKSTQWLLYKMQPKSRQDNNYCKRVRGSFSAARSRYHGINSQAFYKYRTIELRMHSSTIDFVKISNWINILLNIKQVSQVEAIAPVRSINTLVKKYKLERMRSYIESRMSLFKNDTTEVEADAA